MTPEKLIAMDEVERNDYYHALYQEAGKLLFMIPDMRPSDKPAEDWYYFPEGKDVGWWQHVSLHSAVMGIADALAGLVDYYYLESGTDGDQ